MAMRIPVPTIVSRSFVNAGDLYATHDVRWLLFAGANPVRLLGRLPDDVGAAGRPTPTRLVSSQLEELRERLGQLLLLLLDHRE